MFLHPPSSPPIPPAIRDETEDKTCRLLIIIMIWKFDLAIADSSATKFLKVTLYSAEVWEWVDTDMQISFRFQI